MFYNGHTHTKRSHDSVAEPMDICAAALARGFMGLAFTDHCDCNFDAAQNAEAVFDNGEADYKKTLAAYGNQLRLHFGIELGDPLYHPSFAANILSRHNFDSVLLSVHSVRVPGLEMPFSRIDFTDFTPERINAYLRRYFEDALLSVRTFDFDVFCHLTVPLKYICLRYQKQAELTPFATLIDEILSVLIERNKALEINTSMLLHENGFFMPDENIIDRYVSLGGSLFYTGTDAHTADALANGLADAHALLRRKNVKSLCFYEKRQRRFYDL